MTIKYQSCQIFLLSFDLQAVGLIMLSDANFTITQGRPRCPENFVVVPYMFVTILVIFIMTIFVVCIQTNLDDETKVIAAKTQVT